MSDYPPLRGAAYTVQFPIFDASGAFLPGAVIASSRVRKDAGAINPSANAVAEIGEGLYDLTFSVAEMTADVLTAKIVSNGRPVFIRIETVVRQIKDLAFPAVSGRSLDVAASGQVHADPTDLLDLTDGIESGLTLRQAHRLEVAAAAGKLSGAVTGAPATVRVRNAVADTKDRIVANCDADGNRLSVTPDVT